MVKHDRLQRGLRPYCLCLCRTVDANIALVNVVTEGLAPAPSDSNQIALQRRQLELNVQIRELEIQHARAAFEAEQASGAAFTQARMLQDFIQSGLTPAKARNMTDEVLGVVGSGPSADSNE
ncbi:hypothetical protein PtB15_3B457 [Puccinia triticina]|nr:hypothetical protein PtB15_3B457 [Puccinia triticina]